jgi:hypothetical protein
MGPNAKGAAISIGVALVLLALLSLGISWATGSMDAPHGSPSGASTVPTVVRWSQPAPAHAVVGPDVRAHIR